MNIDLDELRPIIHQHVCMLTTAGQTPARAIAIATHVAALIYSDFLAEAMGEAADVVKSRKKTCKS